MAGKGSLLFLLPNVPCFLNCGKFIINPTFGAGSGIMEAKKQADILPNVWNIYTNLIYT